MINKTKIIYISTRYVYLLIIAFSSSFLAGQSMQEIQQIRKEFERAQKNKNILTENNLNPTIQTNLPTQSQFEIYTDGSEDLQEVNKYFGYNFFTNRDSIAFFENLPIPLDYNLGPGDEIIVSLWGQTQLRKAYTISRDGKIYDDKVGLLFFSGKTIKEAKEYLRSQFSRVYSTLTGANPTTYIDVSLGELRSINVNFTGQVSYPGIHSLHPFSTAITGLIQAGGVDTSGSLRNIKIIRDGLVYSEIDFYNFFINGSITSDIQLKNNDIVIIPSRKTKVLIDSAIVNPGIYESKKNESVFDLIQFAGGISHNASQVIGIKTKSSPNIGINDSLTFKSFYEDLNATRTIPSVNVTSITVLPLMNEVQQVEIIGQVKSHGVYHYYENMMLTDLLNISSGFNDSTYLKSVFKDRAEIIRRKPNSKYDEVINFNLGDLIKGENDIMLQNLDRVIIHANLNYFEKKHVKILGEVNIPGNYPVLYNQETLQSFIGRAGGFTKSSFKEGIEVYRDSLRVAWENFTIPLMPGDSVVVKEKPGTIYVTGEVYNPGLIEFDKNKKLKEYINSAGGITKKGDKDDIIVIYANGKVVPNGKFRRTKIKDGSIIVVNQKDFANQFDPTEFATTSLSLISSFVTILVLTQQINNSN